MSFFAPLVAKPRSSSPTARTLTAKRSRRRRAASPGESALTSSPLLVQAKLAVSQPGDRAEREADEAAAHVMRAPAEPGSLPTPAFSLAHPRPQAPSRQSLTATDSTFSSRVQREKAGGGQP